MTDITISSETIQKVLLESIPEILKDKFSSSYSSPLADIISEEIRNEDGAIRTFVKDILTKTLTDPDFKNRMTNEIVGKLLEKALSKN